MVKYGEYDSNMVRTWSKYGQINVINNTTCYGDNVDQKRISDINFDQNQGNLSFSVVFIDFYMNYGPKRTKTV